MFAGDVFCILHQGWAEQRRVHFPIPGAVRGGTELVPVAQASAVLWGLGGSGRGQRKPA